MGCIALVRCVLVLRCGLAGVVWYPDAGWSISWVILLGFDACWCYVVVWLGWCGIRTSSWSPFIQLTGNTIFHSTKILLCKRLLTSSKTGNCCSELYRGADKSLARPRRKQARKHVRDARNFNNIETRAVIKFLFFCKARRRRKFAPLWEKH